MTTTTDPESCEHEWSFSEDVTDSTITVVIYCPLCGTVEQEQVVL